MAALLLPPHHALSFRRDIGSGFLLAGFPVRSVAGSVHVDQGRYFPFVDDVPGQARPRIDLLMRQVFSARQLNEPAP
jgi:hypothetical protein